MATFSLSLYPQNNAKYKTLKRFASRRTDVALRVCLILWFILTIFYWNINVLAARVVLYAASFLECIVLFVYGRYLQNVFLLNYSFR